MLKDLKKSDKKVGRGKDSVPGVERADKKESFMVIKETKEKLQDFQTSSKDSEGGENSETEDEKKEEISVEENNSEEEEEGF